MKRLFFLLLCAAGGLAHRDVALAQAPAPQAPAGFVWEKDSLEAFVKAIEQNKPMVVLFGSPPEFRSETGTNFTNDIRKEFDKPELAALRDRAIFTLGFPDQDEYARRMAVHLKLTDYPTISVIASRTDVLTETYRMEGFFKAADIVADLNKALPKGAAEPAPAANEEKAPLSDADRKAIQETVNAYGKAFKDGNLDQVAQQTAGPFGFVFGQGFTFAKLVGKSKQGVLAAMDQAFGKQNDRIMHGLDDEKIRSEMMSLESLYVLDYDTALGKVVTLQVEATLKNGRKEMWKFVANRPTEPGGKWMVWPRVAAGISQIGNGQAWENSMKKLATAYDALAAEIQAGKYPSREKAHQAAFEAYSRAMSPGFGGGK